MVELCKLDMQITVQIYLVLHFIQGKILSTSNIEGRVMATSNVTV